MVAVGAITPAPAFVVYEDDGETLFDLTGYTAALVLDREDGTATTTLTGTLDLPQSRIDFAWGTETDTAGNLRSTLIITGASFFTPTYLIYDPAELWVNPYDVEAIAGEDYTDSQVVRATLFAQNIVRAWVSVPVQSPVPDPIRQATTLLAARALTTATDGESGHTSGRVVSETIADYTVRYADPGGGDFGMGGWIAPDIAALLAPYHGGAFQITVGPANPDDPLPITATRDDEMEDYWP